METVAKKNALKGVNLFSSLTESDLSIMASISNHKSFPKDQTLFHEGDPGGVLFILLSGEVKITTINASNEEVILNRLRPPNHFGEISLLDGQSRSATATSVEDAEVLAIDRDDFIRLITKKPEFVLNIMAALTLVVRNLTEKVKRGSGGSQERRSDTRDGRQI